MASFMMAHVLGASLPRAGDATVGLVVGLVVVVVAALALKPRDAMVRRFAALVSVTALSLVAADHRDGTVPPLLVYIGALGLQPLALGSFCIAFTTGALPSTPTIARDHSVWPAQVLKFVGRAAPAIAGAHLGLTVLRLPGAAVALYVLLSLQCVAVISGLAVLTFAWMRVPAESSRTAVAVVAFGVAAAYAPTVLGAYGPQLLGLAPALPTIVSAALLYALCAAVGFASLRWHPGGLIALIDRVSVYALLASFLLLVYAATVLFAERLIDTRGTLLPQLLTLAFAILAAITYAPVRAQLERRVDTLFYRDYYELGATIQRFSQQLATLRTHDDVVNLVLDGLTDTLNLSGIAFLALPEDLEQRVLSMLEAGDLRGRRQYATASGKTELLCGLAALDVHQLKLPARSPLLLDPWPGCAALLTVGAVGDGSELALVLVGPKRAGVLRPDDRALLVTVANQMAAALANARLVAGLRTSLAQVHISTSQLMQARAEQQLLLRELVNADERQRAALAHDLHDDALQEVMYLVRHARLCIELAQQVDQAASREQPTLQSVPALAERSHVEGVSAPAAVHTALSRLSQELRQVSERASVAEQRLRALYQGLYPALLPTLGLAAALEDLVRELAVTSDLTINFTSAEPAAHVAAALAPESALHLYRIAQEALRNADRHASARHAIVRLSLDETSTQARPGRQSEPQPLLRLEIEDDGRGILLPIDHAALLRGGHLGLAGMRERAARIGATLRFERAPTGGTLVILIAPTSQESGYITDPPPPPAR